MGAAAQFDRVAAPACASATHRKHANFVAIFLAEQRHCARLDRVVRAHQAGADGFVGADFGVHLGLDRGDILIGQRLGMREVEAQAVFGDQRTLLGHMLAKPVAERRMHQVGRRVVGADLVAPLDIDIEMNDVALADGARLYPRLVRVQPAERLAGVGHCNAQAIGRGDHADIACLTAALAIERRLVGEDNHLIAFGCTVDFGAILHQRDHAAFAAGRGVAGELGASLALGKIEPDLVRSGIARALPCGAGGFLLAGHGGIETVAVDPDIAHTQGVFGKVVRETVGIIELEGGFAVEFGTLAHVSCRIVKQAQALVERAAELGFLPLEHFGNQRLPALQFRVCLTHLGDEFGHQAMHQRLARTQQMRMAHRAAHDAAQDVTAAFVRGQHTVGQQEAGRTQVIGDHPMACLLVTLRLRACEVLRCFDQIAEGVGIVIVVHALHDRSDTLQPHAGVYRGFGQVAARAVRRLVELHEDEVPYLDEAIAILIGRAGRAAGDMLAVIVEYLAARAAGAGIAHRPEIVAGGDANDAIFGQARDLAPQVECLVIGVIDGGRQLVGGQAPFLRQQRPCVEDRLLLEVVAEAEIAEHLEEGMMPRGVADIVEIIVLAACAHAFLAAGGARRWRGFEPGKDVLERHHPGVDEHQCRIVVGHQRRAGHDLVVGAAEEFEERAADIVGRLHRGAVRASAAMRQVD